MNKRGFIWLIAVILILAAVGGAIVMKKISRGDIETERECLYDSDCIPSSCCHARSCVSSSHAPNCSDSFCSMICEVGSLDCGQGECKCSGGKCSADIKLMG